MVEKLKVAVLLPTYDELGSTIDLSLENIASQIYDVDGIAWALFIGVNGTSKLEEVARVLTLVNSYSQEYRGVTTSVSHYPEKGKENAMNHLATEARNFFGESPDLHIGTDLKVFRTQGAFQVLVEQFLPHNQKKENPRYLGGNVLPYPVEHYEKYHKLSPEQRLFYILLEIDKDPEVRALFPKTHLRGGLYVTGKWTPLYVDSPDDYTMTRRARLEYGEDAIQIAEDAVGYVIPRQSFADYFAVRLKRSVPAEEKLKNLHPELASVKEKSISRAEEEKRLRQLQEQSPSKHALYLVKKNLDRLVRELALNMAQATKMLNALEEKVSSQEVQMPREMNLENITQLALVSPELAAQHIVLYYRPIVESLVVDPHSISYGPREERYRGMLPVR
jgi:hypothetical protein